MTRKAIINLKMRLKNWKTVRYVLVLGCFLLFLNYTSTELPKIPTAKSVLKITEKVADWHLKQNGRILNNNNTSIEGVVNELHWTNGLLYTGMMQLHEVSHYPKYINWLIDIGERNNWKLDSKNEEVQEYTVSQMYLSIYEHPHLNEEKVITPTQERLDMILNNSKENELTWKTTDELIKKPLVWAKLSKIKKDKSKSYLAYMHEQYQNLYKKFWDKEVQLFLSDRTHLSKKEKDKEKLFSSEENSFVFAGLAVLIPDLPSDWEHKKFYTALFVQMAQTLKNSQKENGSWFSDLKRNKESYKYSETSVSSNITSGIAWGINNGLLDKKTYEPTLLKSWNRFVTKVNKNGEFAISKNSDELQANTLRVTTASFLAAGSEMYKYITTFYPIDKSTPHITFMKNGGWCWYQDPRVLISEKKLIIGGLDGQNGNALLGVYDLQNEREDSTLILHENLGADDHNVPVFYKHSDKSILAVWAKHAIEKTHYYSISDPKNYVKWSETKKFEHEYEARMGVTYMNLFYIKNQEKLYNFFRDGLNFNPSFITSSNHGKTWGNRTHFISNDVKGFQRPYAKYLQIDENTIGISYTDAHPRNYGDNLYYAEFSNNNFYTVDGTFIKSLNDGPLFSSSAEKIYTGSSSKIKSFVNESVPNSAWTCAMAKDKNNHPQIGYTLYLNDSDLRFRISSWDGKKWNDREIAYAGKCLYKAESSYTGLLTFDPEDPTNVYISPDVNPSTGKDLGGNHEIYSAKIGSKDDISTIKWQAITSNSPHRNIRPIVVSDDGNKVLLWLYGPWHTFKNYDTNVVGIILKRP